MTNWQLNSRDLLWNKNNMAEPNLVGADLQNLFLQATEFVKTLRGLKNENKLKFYGLFKQVSC